MEGMKRTESNAVCRTKSGRGQLSFPPPRWQDWWRVSHVRDGRLAVAVPFALSHFPHRADEKTLIGPFCCVQFCCSARTLFAHCLHSLLSFLSAVSSLQATPPRPHTTSPPPHPVQLSFSHDRYHHLPKPECLQILASAPADYSLHPFFDIHTFTTQFRGETRVAGIPH